MTAAAAREITCAHSPDSDDAFMFYALATHKLRSRLLKFRHVLADIETLNRKAVEGAYELTAISYHAYPYVADKYVLMASGSSVGDGYGPLVVALGQMAPSEIKTKRIAVPGTLTLRGRSAPVTVDVEAENASDTWRVHGSARVKQSAFGIKPFRAVGGGVGVKDEVEIELSLTFRPRAR